MRWEWVEGWNKNARQIPKALPFHFNELEIDLGY